MRNLKGVLLLGIIISNLTPLYPQGTPSKDTTRLYCQPIWIAWRVQRDLNRLDIVDAALDSAAKTIVLKNKALSDADRTIQAQDSAYQAKDFECQTVRSYHKLELKQERKTGRTEGAVVGGIIGIIMTVLALLSD